MADSAGTPSHGESPPDVLSEWVVRLAAALEIPPEAVDISEVLELAKDAAHAVARPAAPVTTFMAGYAAGRAGGSRSSVVAAVHDATALARESP